MSQFARSPVTAVLGPTNTGKTHLAVERMCGHASGMIGFPLRLLAREVYDRVVRMKGPTEVALITGEEKILPPKARWFCCTAESMPLERETAFVALDEAQLGADPERGHVFTDRLLRARGREETMLLGSDSLRPMLKALVPEAEIVGRPRFSTLSYAGAKKLSRLPRRSAIVAFSAEEVYAVAEALRRLRGGAAVVMGALSPRTRNAQVAALLQTLMRLPRLGPWIGKVGCDGRFQRAAFYRRGHPMGGPLVLPVRHQLPRSRGNAGGTWHRCRSHDHLSLGAALCAGDGEAVALVLAARL